MRKNIGLVAVIAFVVISFGYFSIFSTPASENVQHIEHDLAEYSEEKPDGITGASASDDISGHNSLRFLQLSGQDLECAISYEPEGQSIIEGTFFTSKNQVRGDFLTDSPDLQGQVVSSMIIDGNLMYIWSQIEEDYYGVKIDALTVSPEEIKDSQPIPMEQMVNYDCRAWPIVDFTVFDAPGYVLFTDLSDLSKNGMEDGTIYEERGEF